MSLFLSDVRNDLLDYLGYESANGVPAYLLQRVANDINAAFQELWSLGNPDISRATKTINTVANVEELTLTSDVASVTGPVWRDVDVFSYDFQIHKLNSRLEFLNLRNAFISSTYPYYYFLEITKQQASDSTLIKMLLYPAPVIVMPIRFDCLIKPPRYAVADFDVPTIVPIPHEYIESVFLPICRMRLASSDYFTAKDNAYTVRAIEADYQKALRIVDRTMADLVGNYVVGTPHGY